MHRSFLITTFEPVTDQGLLFGRYKTKKNKQTSTKPIYQLYYVVRPTQRLKASVYTNGNFEAKKVFSYDIELKLLFRLLTQRRNVDRKQAAAAAATKQMKIRNNNKNRKSKKEKTLAK